MNYLWAVATHTGRKRPINQDAVHPTTAGKGTGPLVVMVADGMGGHVGGEIASRIAVNAAVASTADTPTQRVRDANQAILDEIFDQPNLTGMGTTLTLVELRPAGVAEIAHVGDSRAYLLSGDTLELLTTDHTVVHEMVSSGQLTPTQAEIHPDRSKLTRALGFDDRLDIDTIHRQLQPGDRLLVCSDGINRMLSDEHIHRGLSDADDPEQVVWYLVEEANRAGGLDNSTALVVDLMT